MADKPTTVDEYVAAAEPATGTVLRELRRQLRAALPGATETISYEIPTWSRGGRAIVHVAGWRDHLSVYPAPAFDEDLERRLAPYRSGRSTLKFPLAEPIPYDLVVRVATVLAERRPT